MSAHPPRHLVALWNPVQAQYAMDQTLQLLRDRDREREKGLAQAADVYVWWGRRRSPERTVPLPHLADILALDHDLVAGRRHRELALYLTDYRVLYVGDVSRIVAGDIRKDSHEMAAVPAFAHDAAVEFDCWFKLRDIRRIIGDGIMHVITELRALRNPDYYNRPVSIYGGLNNVPLIVERPDNRVFFDVDERARLADGRLWAEFDASRSGIGRMELDLRENVIGPEVWDRLDPATRTFAASAEKVFREERETAGFDFATAVIDFAKAIEVETNRKLQAAALLIPVERRQVTLPLDRRRHVTPQSHFTMGELRYILGPQNALFRSAVGEQLEKNGRWFTTEWPGVLEEMKSLRDRGAHSDHIDRDKALEFRRKVLGIGCDGYLELLGRTVVRDANAA